MVDSYQGVVERARGAYYLLVCFFLVLFVLLSFVLSWILKPGYSSRILKQPKIHQHVQL